MQNIARYDATDLAPLVAEARAEAGGDFAPAFMQSVAKQIKSNPRLYRTFGPYWWVLKRELAKASIGTNGDYVDAETANALDYGSTELNLAACYLAQQKNLETYFLYSNTTMVELISGETVDYVLEDQQLELLIAGGLASG